MVTAVVDDGQGGDSTMCEDGQSGDERSVRVDVGDVGVRPHTELLQSLLHEGRHGHLTHLTHTHVHRHAHTHTFICISLDQYLLQINSCNHVSVHQGAVQQVYCV